MLPPFRVKKLIPRAEAGPSGYPGQNYLEYLQERSSGAGAADGIIRMSRQAYDELLEREPNAALTYLDEEDGDVVLVGSSLELGHRLQDPLPRPPYRLGTAELNAAVLGMPPTHAFDIQRQENIIAEWQELERQTAEAREENRRGQKMPVSLAGDTLEPIEPVRNIDMMGFPVQEARTEGATATTTPSKTARFGESSPLSRNAPKLSPTEKMNEGHAKRWASYSSLPGVFDPALMGVVEKSGKFMEKQKEIHRIAAEMAASTHWTGKVRYSFWSPEGEFLDLSCEEYREYVAAQKGAQKADDATAKEDVGAGLAAPKAADVTAKENLGTESSKQPYRHPNVFTNSTPSSSAARWTSSSRNYDVPDFVLATGDTLSPEELRLMSFDAGQYAKAEYGGTGPVKEVRAGSSKHTCSSNPSINKTSSTSAAFRTGREGDYVLPDFVFANGDVLSPEELRWAAYDKASKEKAGDDWLSGAPAIADFFSVSDWEGDLHDSPADADVHAAQGKTYQRQVVLQPEEKPAVSTAGGMLYEDYLACLKSQPTPAAAAAAASIAAVKAAATASAASLSPAAKTTVQSTPDVKQTDGYQPLLSHFQEQLQRLGTPNTTNDVEPTTVPDASQKVPELPASVPNQAKNDPVEARLADSLRSISLGVSQLVAAVQTSKVELNNTLNLACQDFPRGLKEAVKAGANAVDVLRGVPVQSTAQAPSVGGISKPLETEATPTKVAISAPKPFKPKVLPDGQKDKVLWIPRRIVTRRQICYGPEVNTTMHEVEYLVTWLDRPLADAVWYKESMIMQMPLLKALVDGYNKSMAIRATHPEPANTVFDGMIAKGHERFHLETIGNLAVPALRHFPGSTQRRQLRHIPESLEEFKRLPQVLRAVASPMPSSKPAAAVTHCDNSSKDHSKVGIEPVLPLDKSKPDPNRSRPWVESEDHLLQELMRGKDRAILSYQVWVNMAKKFINRSPNQLKTRWTLLLQQDVQASAPCGPIPELKQSEPVPRDPVQFDRFVKQKQSETVAAKSRNVKESDNLVEAQVCDSSHWDAPVSTAALPTQAPAAEQTAPGPTVAAMSRNVNEALSLVEADHWDAPVSTAALPTPAPATTQTEPRPVPIWAQTASHASSEHAHHQTTRAPLPPMMDPHYLGSNNGCYEIPAPSDIAHFAYGMNQGYIAPVCLQPAVMQSEMQIPANPAISATQNTAISGQALADYQMQLILLEQQNKRRLAMARQEQDAAGTQTNDVEEMPQNLNTDLNPNPNVQGGALADYQMQLMLLEQQNKRRLMLARQEQDLAGKQHIELVETSVRSSSSGLQAPLMPSILNSKVSKLNQDLQPQTSVNAYQPVPTVDTAAVNGYAAAPAMYTAANIDDRAMPRAPTRQQQTRDNPAFQEVCAGIIPDVFHMFQDDLFDYTLSESQNNLALDNAATGVSWIMAHPHSDVGIEVETPDVQHMVKTLRTLLAPIPLDDIHRLSKYRMQHEGGSYRQSAYEYYTQQPPAVNNAQAYAPPIPARPWQDESYDGFAAQSQDFGLNWFPPTQNLQFSDFPVVPSAMPTAPSTFHRSTTKPTQPSTASRLIIDRCIETLLDMGYEPRSRVEAIAASADGDFHTAMDLLEEDDRAKNRMRKGKDKANPNADLSVPGGWGAWDGWDVGNFEEDSGVEGLD